MNKLIVSVAVAAVLMNSAAFAATGATLSDVSGKVLVNSGDGFIPATGSMTLSVGDKILVGEGSFAVISYTDCAVSLSKPAVVTVAGRDACASAPADSAVVQPAGFAAGIPLQILLVGGVVAVGGILWVTGAFKNNASVSGP